MALAIVWCKEKILPANERVKIKEASSKTAIDYWSHCIKHFYGIDKLRTMLKGITIKKELSNIFGTVKVWVQENERLKYYVTSPFFCHSMDRVTYPRLPVSDLWPVRNPLAGMFCASQFAFFNGIHAAITRLVL